MSWFVTFEGPEGAGKTTQCQLLAARLEEHGVPVLLTREPGGTPVGEAVREWLLAGVSMRPETEVLLFTAARAEHVWTVIRPALANGRFVVCDRYVDSTLAYQGAGRGLDEKWLRALHQFATGDLWPDLTILLDVPIEIGLGRRRAADAPLTRLDQEVASFHERVRAWYHAAAQREPARWLVVDATMPVEAVADVVWQAVERLLARGRRGK
ncbi:dTMP kinase [Thermomicrobium sp. 4228-Ro]|uniref:dTMP kinase n=1 Tax=Thermomicrobium sp. 4228-Ro TaxID=2993937 RepID=UPI002248E069|nr:dTMP kinase [Thermomicrobium sp. 4228-Ro]MCX2727329.1 dTMP kinase [Thermomicrobium sp. 4228-Ro]